MTRPSSRRPHKLVARLLSHRWDLHADSTQAYGIDAARLLPTTGIGLIRLLALYRGTLPRMGIAYESHTRGVSGTRVSADTVDSRFT